MHNIGAGAILAALYDDELAEEVDPPEVFELELDSDDLGEDYIEWTPYCWDDCEMCGCHGYCQDEDENGDHWEESVND